MVRWMRTAQIAIGKAMPAIGWSKEIAEFVKKYEGVSSVDVFLDIFGELGTIRWIVDYEDLATLEKVEKQIMEDQEYWQRLEKTKEFFVESKAHDIILRSI
jgi:hypothetical protein